MGHVRDWEIYYWDLPVNGHLDHSYLSTATHSAAKNIHEHVSKYYSRREFNKLDCRVEVLRAL